MCTVNNSNGPAASAMTYQLPDVSISSASHFKKCSVQLLDDSTLVLEFKKTDAASVLFDKVCDCLGLVERDYFGLRFIDDHKHRYWLDLTKPIVKQAHIAPLILAFRVKFYPENSSILKEELTRYLLVSQLRRDMIHGRLYCPQNDMAILAAYIIQAELGNQNQKECVGNYVSQFKLVFNQTPKLEEKIAAEHKKLKGMKPSQCDVNFLKKATSLDIYGYAPYSVKDSKIGQVYLGSKPRGAVIYQANRKIHDIKWDDIEDMDCYVKDFYIYMTKAYADAQANLQENPNATLLSTSTHSSPVNDTTPGFERPPSALSNRSHTIDSKKKRPHLKLICPNATYSKHLWKYFMEQKIFFTKPKALEVKSVVRRHFLSPKSTFRWYPRTKTLKELQELKEPLRSPGEKLPDFKRYSLIKQAVREERATDAAWTNKFHTLPGRKKKLEMPTTGGESPILEPTPQWGPLSEVSPATVSVPLALQQTSVSHTTYPVVAEHPLTVQDTPAGRVSGGAQMPTSRPTVLKYETMDVQKNNVHHSIAIAPVESAGGVTSAPFISSTTTMTTNKGNGITTTHANFTTQSHDKQPSTKQLGLIEDRESHEKLDTTSLKTISKTSRIKDWISTKIFPFTSNRDYNSEKQLKEHTIAHEPTSPIITYPKTANGWTYNWHATKLDAEPIVENLKSVENRTGSRDMVCCVLRYSMLALLLLICLLLLIVAAMEYSSETWRHTMDTQPLIDNFRRAVYDPWRRRTCQWFEHY